MLQLMSRRYCIPSYICLHTDPEGWSVTEAPGRGCEDSARQVEKRADSLPLTYSRAIYKLVMPDDVLDKVSRSASFINTVDSLELLVGHRWATCKDHAAIVIEILKRACKESAKEKTSKYGTRKRQPLQDITNLGQSRVTKQQKVSQ